MSGLRSFRATLCDVIAPDDTSWKYHVPKLPQPKVSKDARLIKCVSVVSTDEKEHISLQFQNAPSNRVTNSEPLDRFILISFSQFRLRWLASSPEGTRPIATAKQTADYIARLLVTGVVLNGIHYHFFGHSNSQLKSRSCFLYAAPKDEISRKIEAMGDLSKLKSVGKKAKRIGLLFSSAEVALTVEPGRCEDISDVKYNDYIFTDGCGLISVQLANQLVQRRNISFRGRRYRPSVFQIRYRGYKGVLTLDATLHGQVLVQFRESMRKFKDAPDHSFSVVDYAKPYAFGSLNDEVVVLLYTLGISEDTLLRKQRDHLEFLQRVGQGSVQEAFQFLSYCDRVDLAERLLLDGVGPVRGILKSLVKEEYARMLNKRDEQRCRILIPQSRLLFGVCDPTSKGGSTGKLREGECFVRVTLDGDGRPHTIINTEVLVTRNPCLHPGDLQKFRAVNIPEFAETLVDCIVFSTQGRRPSADLMSGGDLDGDKFFVTWDSEIIPSTIAEPAEYPGGREQVTFGAVTDDQRAEYFARYTNASLGKVKNLYMKWARLGNSMSPECQQLNRLFSQCVDGNLIRIPKNLEDIPEPDDHPERPPFILDVLHKASTDFIQNALEEKLEVTDDVDIVELLLRRDKVALSEFEMLKLTLRWCNRHNREIMAFANLFNFSALSDEEKNWFLSGIPESSSVPSLVLNGLLQSSLVYPQELRRFGLDHPSLHWKPVFCSERDRMGRFFDVLCTSLETFHKKLVILSIDERLSLAIYIPAKIPRADEFRVDASVRVFALPHTQGSSSSNYKATPTKVNYRLYCDEHQFSLYNGKRRDTWIFMTRSQLDDSSFRNEKRPADRRKKKQQTVDAGLNSDCKISVALDKIGKTIKEHVGPGGVKQKHFYGAEIFVISNRDARSMAVLDRWLEFVGTDEVTPLFEPLDLKYNIQKLDSVDWSAYSPNIVTVVRDRDLSTLRKSRSVDEWLEILQLLQRHGEKVILRQVYNQMLALEASNECLMDKEATASMLLDFLTNAIYLSSLFLESQTWTLHKDRLEERFIHSAPFLLSQLVLASNEYQGFVRLPFALILRELTSMSLSRFAELIELIALSVRSSESALDLLIELLEPETSRLLVGRPLIISQFVNSLFGIALDHVDEAGDRKKPEPEHLILELDGEQDGFAIVKSIIRIDSSVSSTLKIGDHVRLTASRAPENAPLTKPASMDAIVLSSMVGSATFKCIHSPPPYVNQCAWNITHCGSFVTSKSMFDAVLQFYSERAACCRVFAMLVGLPCEDQIQLPGVQLPFETDASLNNNQNAALEAAMTHSLTFIWGPPGTGKTHTIAVLLVQLLNALPESRYLITAPTHNAVDNILRRYITYEGEKRSGTYPLRVSTQLSRVSPDLRSYTCDAIFGKDLSGNSPARRKAQKRIKEARLVFTTCAGAGLGLLRTENFDVVVVDEASQQTEPTTLIPLVKGCSRAILVGDHVQLRATVQRNAVLTGFDVSLFERHYNLPSRKDIAKVMLDEQYRMQRTICDFSSAEFYKGKLKTAVADSERLIPPSLFPWVQAKRLVWLECGAPEDLGTQSKANPGQVQLCKQVIQLLTSTCEISPTAPKPQGQAPSIAILTPYTRQKQALQSSIPNIEVSSIDGFQGREADIIVFVTVRCNVKCEMGFLTDMRRLNVVMTRARSGVVIIGNRNTLAGATEENKDEPSKRVWKNLIGVCHVIESLPATGGIRNGNRS